MTGREGVGLVVRRGPERAVMSPKADCGIRIDFMSLTVKSQRVCRWWKRFGRMGFA